MCKFILCKSFTMNINIYIRENRKKSWYNSFVRIIYFVLVKGKGKDWIWEGKRIVYGYKIG